MRWSSYSDLQRLNAEVSSNDACVSSCYTIGAREFQNVVNAGVATVCTDSSHQVSDGDSGGGWHASRVPIDNRRVRLGSGHSRRAGQCIDANDLVRVLTDA